MFGRRRLAGIVLAVSVLGLAGAPAAAAPKAELWPRWEKHDPASTARIDHGAYDRLLKAHVKPSADGINRFAYAAVGAADKQALAAYLDRLQATAIGGFNRAEQKAYWINLYNALTLKVILDRYPVKSIRDISISPGLFSSGPWGRKLVKVEGEELTLDDIEHRILRPIWQDVRVHYAVNCGSLGCPNLPPEAFTAANSEKLLEEGARAYVNHPRGARVEGGRLYTSSIYVWFKDDFGGSDAGVIAHLRKYAAPALAAQLAGVTRIADDAYDWTLNEPKG